MTRTAWTVVALTLTAVVTATAAVTFTLGGPDPPPPGRAAPPVVVTGLASQKLIRRAAENVCTLRRAGQPGRVIVGLFPAADRRDAAAVVAYAEDTYCPAYKPGGTR